MNPLQFGHIVIDLETLATTPNAHVLSVGVCSGLATLPINEISSWEMVMPGDQPGRVITEATLQWWHEDDNRRSKYLEYKNRQSEVMDDLQNTVLRLHQLIQRETKKYKDYLIWGNSPRFDLGILENLFQCVYQPIPWDFRKEGDYKTLRRYAEIMQLEAEDTLYHDAFQDARAEFKNVVRWNFEIAATLSNLSHKVEAAK